MFLLATALVVLVSHVGAADAPFAWDDYTLISDSPAVTDPSPATILGGSFWSGSSVDAVRRAYYRPAVTASFALDWAVGRGRPGVFHLVNVLLHVAVCVVAFRLCVRLGASPAATSLAVALFGTFPRLTESVSWVSGRTDVLATLFALLAIWIRSASTTWPARFATAISLLLALLSKEVALAGVAGLCVLEWQAARDQRESPTLLFRRLGPAAASVAAYAALRWTALPVAPLPKSHVDVQTAFLRSAEALGWYVRMMTDPLHPTLFIGYASAPDRIAMGIGGMALVALLASVVAVARRGPPHAACFVVAAAGALLMAAIVFTATCVPEVAEYVAADRFLYFPLACTAVAFGAAGVRASRRIRRASTAGALAVVAVFVPVTAARAREWRDEVLLWSRAVRVAHPDAALPTQNLADALRRAGLPDDAEPLFAALARRPNDSVRHDALVGLALSQSDRGASGEALATIAAALALEREPRASDLRARGVILARAGRFSDARIVFEDVLSRNPRSPSTKMALEMLAASEREDGSLFPVARGEPTSAAAHRARFLERWGAMASAAELWTRVREAHDATTADREAAGRFARDYPRATSRYCASIPHAP